MSAGGSATSSSHRPSPGKISHPLPNVLAPHGSQPVLLPADSQFCKVCNRGWPVAVFSPYKDGTRDMGQTTCLECLDPGLYAQYWEKLRGKMARRIRREELRGPERRADHTATRSMYAEKAALAEEEYIKHPSRKTRERLERHRQLAAGHVLEQAAPRPPPPEPIARPPPAGTALPVGPLQAPAGSAVVSQMVYNQPQVLYDHRFAEPPARHAEVQASSGQVLAVILAPTILRSIQEPLRSIIWLKINYTFSQPDSVSQNSVYASYVQAISPGMPLHLRPGFDQSDQPVDPAKPVNYFPPAAMKGVEFVSTVPRIFPGVKLNKEGFVCSSLRRKTEKERQELWGLVEPALRGSGAAHVVRALLSLMGGPGLASLAHARPTPQPVASDGANSPLPKSHRAAGPTITAAREQSTSSGNRNSPLPSRQAAAASATVVPTRQSAIPTGQDPLLPSRHRFARPINAEPRNHAATARHGQSVPSNSTGVTPASETPMSARPIAAPAPQPFTPISHPIIVNRIITPSTSTPNIPAKKKVLDMSSRSSSPIIVNRGQVGGMFVATRGSPPDGNSDPFALRPPGSAFGDTERARGSAAIVLRQLPSTVATAAAVPPLTKMERPSLGTAIDDAIEID